MKVTLDLDDPADVVADLRERGSYSTDLVAEQIEAQLPKPIPSDPPEPKGDALLVDGNGVIWGKDEPLDRWYCLTDKYPETPWPFLESGEEFTVYRPVPSPEAVEALVQDFAQQVMNGGPWVSQVAIANNTRGFALRLLGGES